MLLGIGTFAQYTIAQLPGPPKVLPFQVINLAPGGNPTTTFLTSVDVPIGSLAVIFTWGWSNLGDDASASINDTVGNTYLPAAVTADPSGYNCGIYYCSNTAFDIPSGTIVSVTGTNQSVGFSMAAVAGYNGGLGISVTQTGSALASTLSSGLLPSSSSVLFAAWEAVSGISTYADGPGFTTIGGDAGGDSVSAAFQVVVSPAAVVYGNSWTPSQQYETALVSFNATGGGPIPETNTHLIGRFVRPQFSHPPMLRMNNTPPVTAAAVQPETQPHFIGRFKAPAFNRFKYNLTPEDKSSWGQETNPHFVGRFKAPVLSRFRYNVTPEDVSSWKQETNTHFIGWFKPSRHAISPALRQNVAGDLTKAAETNTHFVARPWPVSFKVLPGLRQNVPSNDAPIEVQPHFLGRFTAPSFARVRYDLTPSDLSSQAQAETNIDFLGRFSQIRFNILPGLRGNIAADTSTAQTQPDTQPHFIGRFSPAAHRVMAGLRSTPASDTQPETNTHFVPRYAPVAFVLLPLLRSNQSTDAQSIVVPETNTHFIGRHQAASHRIMPALRSAPADDIPVVETNTHFLGRFTPTQHYLLRSLRLGYAFDEQPETNTHMRGRFAAPVFARAPARSWDTGQSGPLPRQPETNVHPFVGRFTAPVFKRFPYNFSGCDLTSAKPVPIAFTQPTLIGTEIAAALLGTELALALMGTEPTTTLKGS